MRPVLLALALLAPTAPQAAKDLPAPGLYDSLQLAVDPATGALSGYFFDSTGAGQFSCGFLVYNDGHREPNGSYRVITWWPAHEIDNPKLDDEVTPGTLRFTGSTAHLIIPTKNAHGGCWNVNGDLNSGKEIELRALAAKPAWRQMRVVKDPKLAFYTAPTEPSKTRRYVVKGDVLAATAQQGEWVRADYKSDAGKSTSGWVHASGLLPFLPPAK